MQKEQWVEALPLIEFAYNNSVYSATRVSLFQAIHGYSLAILASLLVPRVLKQPLPKEFADKLMQQLRIIWNAIQESQKKSMQQVQKYEDQHRGHPEFQEGDEVLYRRFHFSLGSEDRRKQEVHYDGLYLIKKMLKPSVAVIEGLPPGMLTNINI